MEEADSMLQMSDIKIKRMEEVRDDHTVELVSLKESLKQLRSGQYLFQEVVRCESRSANQTSST